MTPYDAFWAGFLTGVGFMAVWTYVLIIRPMTSHK